MAFIELLEALLQVLYLSGQGADCADEVVGIAGVILIILLELRLLVGLVVRWMDDYCVMAAMDIESDTAAGALGAWLPLDLAID